MPPRHGKRPITAEGRVEEEISFSVGGAGNSLWPKTHTDTNRGIPLLEEKQETLQHHTQMQTRVWLPEREGTGTMKKLPTSFHGGLG